MMMNTMLTAGMVPVMVFASWLCGGMAVLVVVSRVIFVHSALRLKAQRSAEEKAPAMEEATRPGVLGALGRRALRPHGAATQALIEQFADVYAEAKRDAYAESNPGGFIDADTSENKLSFDILEEPIRRALADAPLAKLAGYGTTMRGARRLRAALAGFFERHIFGGEVEASADDIVVCSGISNLLDTVFAMLCDEGDAVLVPAPYHSRFDRNVLVRNGRSVAIVPVPTDSNGYIVTPELLTAASRTALGDGRCSRIRCVLLTNPNNPTATCYSRADLERLVDWCSEHRVHLVSDEVYACTVFAQQKKFVSALAVAAGREGADPDLIHVIYGLSKDFCISGLRIGVFYSRCRLLVEALSGISMFTSVCSVTQAAMASVFEDDALVETYVAENKRRVSKSYKIVSEGLASHGIPFVPAEGGLFVWAYLGDILRGSGGEAEAGVSLEAVLGLCDHLARHSKILVTPSHLCHAEEHGHFRICFAAMSAEALEELVRRLGLCYSYYRA